MTQPNRAWRIFTCAVFCVLVPIVLVSFSVRIAATPRHLALQYALPWLPDDPYGFTTADRLHLSLIPLEVVVYGQSDPPIQETALPAELCWPPSDTSCPQYQPEEIVHLVDVYQVLRGLFLAGVAGTLFTTMIGYLAFQQDGVRALAALLRCGALSTILIIASMAIVALGAWGPFFTNIHRLFFAEGSWQFLTSDTLIRLFPMEFWLFSAIAIGLLASSLALLLWLIGTRLLQRRDVNASRKSTSSNTDQLQSTRGKPSQTQPDLRVVAIGGGTGMPVVLRGLKAHSSEITAIVTMADDGGSSGRLRQELGSIPPGDLRNNVVALADDEDLMTDLFQYRFTAGAFAGHAFGNLFLIAMSEAIATRNGRDGSDISMALVEMQRILNVKGRVLPATLDPVQLQARIRLQGGNHIVKVIGESKIADFEGLIEEISLDQSDTHAYLPSVDAILQAELVVLGPGSLFTSIIPNLVIRDIASALRATDAHKVYVCNVATQPGETTGFSLADHVLAIERHIGRGVFQTILANETTPGMTNLENTTLVAQMPLNHEVRQRYDVRYNDLADEERPWRHDPVKLSKAIMAIVTDVGLRTHSS
jgi:integral membrane protein (TIGR01906 family)